MDMPICANWMILLVLLFPALCVAQKESSELVRKLEQEVRSAPDWDSRAFLDAARAVAQRHDRTALDALLDLRRREAESGRLTPQADCFIALIAIGIADPDGKRGLRSCGSLTPTAGVLVACIDSYHDATSCESLLKIATRSVSAYRYSREGPYACGFLRQHNPESLRPRIEAALKRGEGGVPKEREAREVMARCLRALLSSWEYASKVKDPVQRARYREFEEGLWRAWATQDWGSILKDGEYGDAANRFARSLLDRDIKAEGPKNSCKNNLADSFG